MEKLSFGDTATLANNQKYTCFSNILLDGKDYVFLINHEQETVKIAEQQIVDGQLGLKMVKDEPTKQQLLKLFKNHFADTIISKIE